MSERQTISPEEAEELRHLNTEYFDATRRAAEAMRTDGRPLLGEALQAVLEGDERAGNAMRRIRAIYGI
jgi:hypothetical protein